MDGIWIGLGEVKGKVENIEGQRERVSRREESISKGNSLGGRAPPGRSPRRAYEYRSAPAHQISKIGTIGGNDKGGDRKVLTALKAARKRAENLVAMTASSVVRFGKLGLLGRTGDHTMGCDEEEKRRKKSRRKGGRPEFKGLW